jgi:hypothetical protein
MALARPFGVPRSHAFTRLVISTSVGLSGTHPHTELVVRREDGYYLIMSAVELLKQVKALPAREREKFVLAVLTLDNATPTRSSGRNKRVNWPDVEGRAKRIFGNRVLPNLVLLEREEAAR